MENEATTPAINTPITWPLKGSEYREFSSAVVGDTLAVGIWQLPEVYRAFYTAKGPMPKPKLAYVLDASFALAPAASVCLLQAADMIRPGFQPLLLVGLDYVDGRLNARSRDYVPDGALPESMTKLLDNLPPEMKPGGADKFLRFMETELDPWVREHYEVDPGPAGLLGDSYGGTFAAHAIVRQSPLFDRYWLGSPGLFNTPMDLTGKLIEAISKERKGNKKIFVSIGELEGSGGISYYQEMDANFTRVVNGLNSLPAGMVDWQHRVYPGHTHTSVYLSSLNDALLFLYGKGVSP